MKSGEKFVNILSPSNHYRLPPYCSETSSASKLQLYPWLHTTSLSLMEQLKTQGLSYDCTYVRAGTWTHVFEVLYSLIYFSLSAYLSPFHLSRSMESMLLHMQPVRTPPVLTDLFLYLVSSLLPASLTGHLDADAVWHYLAFHILVSSSLWV